MDKNRSSDPRSIRARKALQDALKSLIQAKPYAKITITDIANEAGLSRHTFYNHYQAKDELLHHVIDSKLGELFSFAAASDYTWFTAESYPQASKQIWLKFFEIWQENPDLVEIIRHLDSDSILINRIRTNLEQYLGRSSDGAEDVVKSPAGQYVLCHNAYAVTGVFRQWIRNDMRHSPEVMADLMDEFSEVGKNLSSIVEYKELVT